MTAVLTLAAKHWRLALIAALLGLLGLSHANGVRLAADRDDWRTASGKWQAATGQWRAYGEGERQAFLAAEAARRGAHAQAVAAVNADAKACDARVAAARKSADAIAAIIGASVHETPDHCPVRDIVGGQRLRDASGLAADPAGR